LRVVSDTAATIRARHPTDAEPIGNDQPVPVEIRPLIAAINDLLLRVGNAQRSQKRFVANAAHQLRTPVSSLQVQIDRALLERDPEGRVAALRHVESAIRRLGRLLHQLLMLARVEPDSQARLELSSCDLTQVAKETVELHDSAAVASHCDLGYAGPVEDVVVRGESALLNELLRNLVENAMQYGGPGTHITIRVETDPPRLMVEDDGPGISPAERDRVLERFYRSPGTAGSGCGLGLAIVQEIAGRHGGTVSIAGGANGRGTRVTVAFPDTKASARQTLTMVGES
jgi:two-component system sensor histidine kinase TctE